MNIGFRVDSSNKIGTGHVNRCITLAKSFKKKGIKNYFISRIDKGNINKKIIKEGFELKKISNRKHDINKDAEKTKLFIKKYKIDLILIDNYLINLLWEKQISKLCKIIFLDDCLKRKTICDYYINYHNLKSKNKDNKFFLNKKCKRFLGPKFSIVKTIPLKKKLRINKKKIFVFMGGVDNKNITSKIISILKSKEFSNYKINIMIGQRNLRKKIIIKMVKKLKNFSTDIGRFDNLYNFFNEANLSIVNAGVTMYENLTFGREVLVIPQSNTHRKILSNYSGSHLINYVESISKLKKKHIINLIKKKPNKNLIKLRKKIFDSKGSIRLTEYFSSL